MATISAGSYDVNHWLCGGYEAGVITVLYGPSGSGKTNFCLQVAASQAKKGNKVLYIDTEGGFSVERMRQLVPIATDGALQNIFLLSPTNFTEQVKAFEQLLKYTTQKISLIVVDGMTILYRLDAATARQREQREIQNVNAALAQQLRVLAEIARKQQIPVLVTNQTYSWEAETKMVAGDLLRYWGKCHIELVQNGNKRTAYLRKHRSLGERTLGFCIVDAGIQKRGWL
jgi:DNA repair protein RadB